MAYATTGLSNGVSIIGGDYRIWIYRSADTFTGTVDVASYFSDGVTRGMIVGDVVFAIKSDGTVSFAYVSSVSGAAASVSALAVSSAPTLTSVTTGSLTATGTVLLGSTASKLVGFYGATGISQRASSVMATTNMAVSASFGATQLATLQEIANTINLLGLHKGTA